MNSRIDLVAFLTGMILVAVAVATALAVLTGLSTEWLKVATPLFLVLVGVLGLSLARPRS